LVPKNCKTALRGKFKVSDNDGCIYATHVLAIIFSLDPESQGTVLNFSFPLGLVDGLQIASMINKAHMKELLEGARAYEHASEAGERSNATEEFFAPALTAEH
jgi:hypothetical protein